MKLPPLKTDEKDVIIKVFISFCLIANTILPARAQSRQEILDLGMPLMEITTVNEEEPSFIGIFAPEGCIGKTITQVAKVPGRVKIMHIRIHSQQPDGSPVDSCLRTCQRLLQR